MRTDHYLNGTVLGMVFQNGSIGKRKRFEQRDTQKGGKTHILDRKAGSPVDFIQGVFAWFLLRQLGGSLWPSRYLYQVFMRR